MPDGTLDALLEDPTGALAQILLYHVVGAKALSTDLSDGQTITTLQGTDVTVNITDGSVYINDAMVILADIEADNGVVHVINAVLTPSTGIRERFVDEAEFSVYPNPAREFVNVTYKLLKESEVRLEMYDMLGQSSSHSRRRLLVRRRIYNTEFPVNESGIRNVSANN